MYHNILTSLALVAASAVGASASEKLPATPFTSFPTLSGRDVKAAVDGDLSTFFYAKDGSYVWYGLDLGEPCIITSVKLAMPTGKSSLLGMVQGANNEDFSDALPIALVKENLPVGSLTELPVECSRGFRYIRYVGPADSHCALSEIEVYGTPGNGDDSHLWQITNLPTVIVNTVNSQEPYDKEHDIPGTICIVSGNGADLLAEPGSIRERGNASRSFPKKPWRLKFDKKQSVLGSPAKAKKWTLINNYGDKTLMRNILAFEIARIFDMEYVPFCQPVDVVLNGEYKGCYQLCDQIEVNKNRVNIDEMEETDTENEALTGGYLLEVDAYAPEEISWFISSHYGIPVTIKSPDDDKITPEQKQYITDYFNFVEQELKSREGYDATDSEFGYRRVFDSGSFIRHMLVNELAGNTDTYWSTFMTKRRNDPKIYTGPVWDFDLGFNNDIRSYPVNLKSGDGYLWNSGAASSANGMLYFAQRVLIKDETTADEIRGIWAEARTNGLDLESLNAYVDETAALLDASQELNFKRWPILGKRVHQNPRAGETYQQEVQWIKEYLDDQINHLDNVIGYEGDNPSTNVTDIDQKRSGTFRISDRAISAEGFEEGTICRIYTPDGRLADSFTTDSRSASLAPGIYIAQAATKKSKIIIR